FLVLSIQPRDFRLRGRAGTARAVALKTLLNHAADLLFGRRQRTSRGGMLKTSRPHPSADSLAFLVGDTRGLRTARRGHRTLLHRPTQKHAVIDIGLGLRVVEPVGAGARRMAGGAILREDRLNILVTHRAAGSSKSRRHRLMRA